MENNMEHEMESGGIQGFTELNLSYDVEEPYELLYIYIPIMVT